MFKFIRRYQKWMLVVFCGGLMVAFLVPQAADQFAPRGEKQSVGQVFGNDEISVGDQRQAASSLDLLKRMGFYGAGLFPNEEDDADEALAWLLMIKAARHAGLSSSDSEAFNALAMKQAEVKDSDTLATFAANLNLSTQQLLGVVREYLLAEQYRQLILGHTFKVRDDFNELPASVGLNRVRQENASLRFIDENQQQLLFAFIQQYGRMPNDAEQRAMAERLIFSQLVGHPRVSEPALRQTLMQEQTRLSGALVVFDADDSTLPPSEEKLRELFEEYKGDFAGTSTPYGFGYRVPGRVRIESVRIPIEQLRAIAATQVTEADVRRYHDSHAALYATWTPRDEEPEEEAAPEEDAETPDANDGEEANEGDTDPADGGDAEAEATESEPEAEPETPAANERVRIDFRLRAEIREALVMQKTQELQQEIATDLQRLFAEDTRVLEERDGFKVLPADYAPTPLAAIAQKIQEEHGVELEVIPDDGTWVSQQDLQSAMGFVSAMLRTMPTRSVWFANDASFAISEMRLSTTTLSGRLGLLSSGIPGAQNQAVSLGRLIAQTKELRGDTEAIMPDQPQVGIALPGATIDETGSIYLSRLTAADPDHPAESLADVREQVLQDAARLAGYETLLSTADMLLEQAKTDSIYNIAPAEDIQELDGFSRANPPRIEGLSPQGMRVFGDAVFGLADEVRQGAGVAGTASADRLIVIELPRERKLLVFLLTEEMPLSQRDYRAQLDPAMGDAVTNIALNRTMPAGDTSLRDALSLESLMKLTEFTWADGYGPAADGASDADDSDSE